MSADPARCARSAALVDDLDDQALRHGVIEPAVGALDRDGKEAVGGVVIARYGVNTLDVISAVKEKLETLKPGLPPGVKVTPFYDRTQLILRATTTLKRALIEELVLVTLAHALTFYGRRYGLASLCLGGGNAVAMVIERV